MQKTPEIRADQQLKRRNLAEKPRAFKRIQTLKRRKRHKEARETRRLSHLPNRYKISLDKKRSTSKKIESMTLEKSRR